MTGWRADSGRLGHWRARARVLARLIDRRPKAAGQTSALRGRPYLARSLRPAQVVSEGERRESSPQGCAGRRDGARGSTLEGGQERARARASAGKSCSTLLAGLLAVGLGAASRGAGACGGARAAPGRAPHLAGCLGREERNL